MLERLTVKTFRLVTKMTTVRILAQPACITDHQVTGSHFFKRQTVTVRNVSFFKAGNSTTSGFRNLCGMK